MVKNLAHLRLKAMVINNYHGSSGQVFVKTTKNICIGKIAKFDPIETKFCTGDYVGMHVKFFNINCTVMVTTQKAFL